MPTGGVSLSTAAGFIEAGAFALGVGADLVDLKAIREGRRRYESACGPADAPSRDGLAAKARDGFRGGALAALRRQATQYEFEVVNDH